MTYKTVKRLVLLFAFTCGTIALAGPPVPKGLENDMSETAAPSKSNKARPTEKPSRPPETPVPPKSAAENIRQIGIEIKLNEKSIKDKARSIEMAIKEKARSNEALDSSIKNSLEGIDTSKLTSFKEIIIDDNGNIKVRTDSGLIDISKSNLDSILPSLDNGDMEEPHHEISSWGKNIVIEEGMRVESDVQVFSGNATVKGSVNGDVLTVGGDIYISSSGYVRGNAIAIGGKVKKEEGAKVTGVIMPINIPFLWAASGGSVYQIIQKIILMAVLFGLILSGLAIALFPKPICLISEQLRNHPGKSFLIGYGSFFGIFIIGLLLIVSVIGIPLAILGQPLAVLLLCILAYTATNLAVGESLFKKYTPLQSYLYGGLITVVIPFTLLLIGYATGSLLMFIINMAMLGLFMFIFLPFGIGASVLARFGFPPKAKLQE